MKNVMFSSYDCQDENVVINDLETGGHLSADDIRKRLDNVKMSRDVFAEMRQLCLYNIIDTSVCKTAEEFIKSYSIISCLTQNCS